MWPTPQSQHIVQYKYYYPNSIVSSFYYYIFINYFQIQYNERIEQLENRLQPGKTNDTNSYSPHKPVEKRNEKDNEIILVLQKELHELEIRLQKNELKKQGDYCMIMFIAVINTNIMYMFVYNIFSRKFFSCKLLVFTGQL